MTERALIGRTVAEIAVGDRVEVTRLVTAQDITQFVLSVGDRNPVHSDPVFAAGTRFERPIAPGLWTGGLISAVIGTHLPGPGSLYAAQTLSFLRPVYPGDEITARVEVVEVIPERNRVRLQTTCRNQQGAEVLTGEAWVLPPQRPIHYPGGPSG